jgi:hypothetical protein
MNRDAGMDLSVRSPVARFLSWRSNPVTVPSQAHSVDLSEHVWHRFAPDLYVMTESTLYIKVIA